MTESVCPSDHKVRLQAEIQSSPPPQRFFFSLSAAQRIFTKIMAEVMAFLRLGVFNRSLFGRLSNFCTGSAKTGQKFITDSPDPRSWAGELIKKSFLVPSHTLTFLDSQIETVNQKNLLTEEKGRKIILSVQLSGYFHEHLYARLCSH